MTNHNEVPVTSVLTPDLLARIRERAAGYDSANVFPTEDFEELVAAGYLKAMLPRDLGGFNWGMRQAVEAQRLLAAHAPATALAVNMHLVWTGVARLLAERGDNRLAMVQEWVSDGEVMAFGISEAGNDSVLFDSITTAQLADDGSYSFTGLKIFTSLAPAWTKLGIFGKSTEGDQQLLVHGFVDRSDPGVETIENWDTLGMRASQSHSTRLNGARVSAGRIHSKLPVGPNADPLIFGIFASFLTLTASVYVGIVDRATEIASEIPRRRRSLSQGGATYSNDPTIRWQIADAGMLKLALDAHARTIAGDLDDRVDHGASWFPRLVTFRTDAGNKAREAVQLALQVSGGGQYYRGTELERLYRDVLASLYHPSDAESAHNTLANWLVGPIQTANES